MSRWIRAKLPDSNTGYMVTDVDFVLYNFRTKRVMLLEVKTRKAKVSEWQMRLLNSIAKWIAKGIDDDWKFCGFHVIRFEGTGFDDGRCAFDNKLITEQELVEKLSVMGD